MHHDPFPAPLAGQAARSQADAAAIRAKLSQAAIPAAALEPRRAVAARLRLVAGRPAHAAAARGGDYARTGAFGRAGGTAAAASPLDAAGLAAAAAACGIDLYGWDADWLGARLFLAGIADERCASFGAPGGAA